MRKPSNARLDLRYEGTYSTINESSTAASAASAVVVENAAQIISVPFWTIEAY